MTFNRSTQAATREGATNTGMPASTEMNQFSSLAHSSKTPILSLKDPVVEDGTKPTVRSRLHQHCGRSGK